MLRLTFQVSSIKRPEGGGAGAGHAHHPPLTPGDVVSASHTCRKRQNTALIKGFLAHFNTEEPLTTSVTHTNENIQSKTANINHKKTIMKHIKNRTKNRENITDR